MECQRAFAGNFFFGDINRSVARPCFMQTRGNAGCEARRVLVLNKESAKCFVLKRLGDEHIKWADTPKLSSRVIAVLNVLVASKLLRRLRSEIHPSHKLRLCSGYFALPRACAGNGIEFVNRCLCTYSQWQMCHDAAGKRCC